MDSPLTRTEKKKQGKRGGGPYSSKHVRAAEALRVKGEAKAKTNAKVEVK